MVDKMKIVKALIRDQDGNFLVVKESESGQWELPGGKIKEELGEERLDAVKREVREETGLKPSSFEDVVRVKVEEFEDGKKMVNCWIMHAEVETPEVQLEERELDDYRWVEPDDFREMDWHADAGYGLPAMVYLEDYLG